MKPLKNKKESTKQRRRKLRNRLISVLTAAVVFTTTYALVLPAITMDAETANAMPGIDVAQATSEQVAAEPIAAEPIAAEPVAAEAPAAETAPAVEPAAEPAPAAPAAEAPTQVIADENVPMAAPDVAATVTPEPVKSESVVDETSSSSTSTSADSTEAADAAEEEKKDDAAEEKKDEEKEEEKEDEAKLAASPLVFDSAEYMVTVSFSEAAALPEGTTLSVREYGAGSMEYNNYHAILNQKLREDGVAEEDLTDAVSALRFYELSFINKDGAQILPASAVDVLVEYKTPTNPVADESLYAVTFRTDDGQPTKATLNTVNAADGSACVEAAGGVIQKLRVQGYAANDFHTNNVIGQLLLKQNAEETEEPEFVTTLDDEEEESITTQYLTADGAAYNITMTYGPEAGIPEGAALAVSEIPEETEVYDEYVSKTEDALEENEKVTFARFFDITIMFEGAEIQPNGPVSVKIELADALTEDVKVVHFEHDDAAAADEVATPVVLDSARVEAEALGNAVGFETDSFSVFGVVGTSLNTEVTLPGSDDTYEVSVTYGPEAKIPEGATLDVKAFAVDSEEYKKAKETVVAAKKAADEEFDEETLGFAALDITINDAQGKPVEPAEDAEVKVSFKMKKLPDTTSEEALANTLEIQHLNETNGTPEVETVAGVQDVLVAGGSAEAEFTITSFSTFTLTWGENSATVHFGTMNGTSFEEFEEETISFDTSANSINIANKFDGYTYQSAVYCTDGQSIEDGVDIDSIINKTTNGWQITQYTTNDNDETVPSQINIVNGSDIYAVYYVPESGNPSGADDNKIPSPTTTKNVTPNGDGTYTIQLDVTGATVTEDTSHYANILVILDATRSMNGSKWTNAKTAMRTLVETLCEGENAANAGKIDFALVTFGRSATVTQNWTKDNAAFKTTCANMNMVSTSGTNWEAGMRGGLYGVLNNMPDDDPTFVIFLTDGDPNVYYSSGSATNYTNSGTTNGYNQNANTSASHSADEAKAIAANTYLYGIYCGDSGTTPSGTSYNRLANVITGSGQGGVKTIAANADTIESEFKAIAETALASMGANSVSVDDGVPSLSSVSAQTVGEAGAFEYYIATGENPSDSDFSTWSDAPGASYSNDNGVTWDLSKVGTLPEKTTYRLKFTVWPSQEAYDLIADLNNGVVTKTDAELEAANIVKGADGKYTLKTNSHLNTTYTFKNVTYTDDNQWTEKEMDLPTETLTVRKIWNNPTDWHIGDDSGNGVKLYLTKDGENYLYGDRAITVAPDSPTDLVWESEEEIYISCGFIKQDTTTNRYEILEDGHDYSIAEPESFAYYWDLKADIYHPMVINGTAHYLIQKDDAAGADGVGYYTLKGSDGQMHKYVLADSGDHVMTATNDRRSNLNLNKIIDDKSLDQGADKDTLFEYTITVNNANAASGKASDTHSDYYVWFSVYDPVNTYREGNDAHLVDDATLETSTNVIAESGNTGYFYAPSGQPITIKIKEGWGLRFLNLPVGTTYSIVETVEDGWEFEGAEGSAIKYERDASGHAVQVQETYNPTVNTGTATISGNIAESNHSYTVKATNKWEPTGTELTVNKVWKSGNFVTAHGTVNVALYKNGAVVPGSVKQIAAPATSVTYDKISTFDRLEVREVIVTTEGTGDDAVTTVTPIDANGLIAVSDETTTLGSNATDTYVVTYSTGTAADNKRTDTVTNTMPQLVVNKNGTGSDRLKDAIFKLTGEDGETALSGYSTIKSTDAQSGNLLNGIYLSNGTYYLVETEAPAGYNKLAYKVKLEVKDNNTVITAVTDPASTTNIADETSDNKLLYTFTVHNSNGTELPNTGGTGTLPFTLGGIGLILASALMYGFRMRRRERRLN